MHISCPKKPGDIVFQKGQIIFTGFALFDFLWILGYVSIGGDDMLTFSSSQNKFSATGG
jgi:hypothetical protein